MISPDDPEGLESWFGALAQLVRTRKRTYYAQSEFCRFMCQSRPTNHGV
jgi:hypothetical protein